MVTDGACKGDKILKVKIIQVNSSDESLFGTCFIIRPPLSKLCLGCGGRMYLCRFVIVCARDLKVTHFEEKYNGGWKNHICIAELLQ